jgi:DNA-binding NarL/FixJ family response regulator
LSAAKEITIVIADDHPLLRLGLRQVIEQRSDLRVIGEAGNGERALELIEQMKPSVAILDIDMPKMDGLEVAKCIAERKMPVEVIILTMYEGEKYFKHAMDFGVLGYVLKNNTAAEIGEAIDSVLKGRHYISPSLSEILLKSNRDLQKGTEKKLGVADLTPAERKVLKLVADNKTTKEISDILFISERTVESHRSNICAKLNLHGQNALLHYALEIKSHLL